MPVESVVDSKIASLSDAMALVHDGDTVALAGFSLTRNAIAFTHELIRQRKRDLTLSACILGLEADLLVGAGSVRKVIYGGGSIDRFGQLQRVNAAIEEGAIIAEYASSLSICFRYLAGALGIPFMPIRSLLGSDLLKQLETETAPGDYKEIDDPFSGEHLVAVRALVPDVAVVQAQMADEDGNVRIYGPRWDSNEAAKAAKQVIVIAETIVPTDVIREQPELTIIPGFRVNAVVPVTFGAYPTSLYRCYDHDAAHLRRYAATSGTQAGFDDYLREFVLGTSNHAEYLEKSGGEAVLNGLRADPHKGY